MGRKLAVLFAVLQLHHDHPSLVMAQPQTKFLTEILLGRCFDNSPLLMGRSMLVSCPVAVGSLVSIIEHQLDSQITVDQFDKYYSDYANFTSPQDEAVFWLVDEIFSPSVTSLGLRSGITLPESTLGGGILDDLIYCGVDLQQDDDCGAFPSQAKVAFWTSAYQHFAQSVSGRVRVVLGEDSDDIVDWFIEEIVPSFSQQSDGNNNNLNDISLLIYNSTNPGYCDPEVMHSFSSQSIETVCESSESFVDWMACGNPGTERVVSPICTALQTCDSGDSSGEESYKAKKKHKYGFLWILIMIIVGCTMYMFCASAHEFWEAGYEVIAESTADEHISLQQ